MKTRSKPKVWLEKDIYNIYTKPRGPWKAIGSINLVDYMRGECIPHIEFRIKNEFSEYRNKGIMTAELKKYLKLCKKWGHNRLIANVKKDNTPSIRVLEKNNFIKMTEIRDSLVYVIDLTFTKPQVVKAIEILYKETSI